jgi:dCMP deaminase
LDKSPDIETSIQDERERELKWHLRFLALAEMVAGWSKDPSTKCGAVIVRPDLTIASVGFNGFPRGCDDSEEIYADRPLKYERVVHAELNAILSCYERPVGHTIYVWPPSNGGACARCAAHIIQSGITRIVHVAGAFSNDRWEESLAIGNKLFKEAGVEVVVLPK